MVLEYYEDTPIQPSREIVYLTIGELSPFLSSSDIQDEIIEQISSDYRLVTAPDGQGGNLMDCIARLKFHGETHFLYESIMNNLNVAIYSKVTKLPMPDLAKLFYDIDDATSGWYREFGTWKTFRESLLQTEQLTEIMHDIKECFLLRVGDYYSRRDPANAN